MKISEVTTDLLINYCNAYEEDEVLLGVFKDSGISYIKKYTGLADEEIDESEDITIALLILVAGMFDCRSVEVDKTNVNVMLDSILNLHSKNLI